MKTTPIYLTAAKRTPIGSLNGALSPLSAPHLGAAVIANVIETSHIDKNCVDEVIMGCVLTAGVRQAPARQAAISAGLPEKVHALTINKVCSSGLKAVMLAADSIRLGNANAIIAGGMESMSNAPYLAPQMRGGARLGNSQMIDSIIHDGLWDVYNNFHMGSAAELCAEKYKLSREMQDAFAIESYKRALAAIELGFFKDEITPLKIAKGKETLEISTDEEPQKVNLEKIPNLKPVFKEGGTVTAANASSINDGAAAMLVCDEETLKANNLTPLARIVAHATHAQAPEWFTTAPVKALELVAIRANIALKDIDLFEINEAFSSVSLACQKDLKISPEKLNISGGAVALGHPIGASGARILTTLLYALKRLKLKVGACGICNGGGEATAIIIERI